MNTAQILQKFAEGAKSAGADMRSRLSGYTTWTIKDVCPA
jgi:hypothetical protein